MENEKKTAAEKRKILVVNGICVVVGLVPLVGLFVIPLLFLVNLILGLVKFSNKENEIGGMYLIAAFLAPLIGFSLCYGVYSLSGFM